MEFTGYPVDILHWWHRSSRWIQPKHSLACGRHRPVLLTAHKLLPGHTDFYCLWQPWSLPFWHVSFLRFHFQFFEWDPIFVAHFLFLWSRELTLVNKISFVHSHVIISFFFDRTYMLYISSSQSCRSGISNRHWIKDNLCIYIVIFIGKWLRSNSKEATRAFVLRMLFLLKRRRRRTVSVQTGGW